MKTVLKKLMAYFKFSDYRKRPGEVKAPVRGADKRLIDTQRALCEIAFARGWNTMTKHPLPNQKFWRKRLEQCRTEEQAFRAGQNEVTLWENNDAITNRNS